MVALRFATHLTHSKYSVIKTEFETELRIFLIIYFSAESQIAFVFIINLPLLTDLNKGLESWFSFVFSSVKLWI